MTDLIKIERFAALKKQIKELEKEAKELQTELIEEGAPEKIKTQSGTLSLTERVTYECNSMYDLRNEIGEGNFDKVVSVTFGKVKKVCGEDTSDALLDNGIFDVKSVSKYYTLRK